MAYGIERRLKRDLFSYALVHKEFYEELGSYEPNDDEYRDLVEARLNQDSAGSWELVKEGLWYNAVPEEIEVADQGFKIHVAATSDTAHDTLQHVLPHCVARRVPFKVVVDSFLLDFINSKNYSRASSGKFMTLYPADEEQCGTLMEELREATEGLKGPHILSDRPYKKSDTIFYRYGGFRPRYRLNVYGEKEPVIRNQEGELVPERRVPFFELPEQMEDPFLEASPETSTQKATQEDSNPDSDSSADSSADPGLDSGEGSDNGPLLADRFAIEDAVQFSNSGGVYKAKDTETGELAILKEARPLVNQTQTHPTDAVDTLHKEARILERLQDTDLVPDRLAVFQEWKHHFLAEEHIDGMTLSSFRALEDIGLLVQRYLTPERFAAFCRRFTTLARNLLEAVRTFHDREIILGDLAPSNVLVDEDTLDVTLIDFEGAFLQGEDEVASKNSMVTTGFVPRRRLEGAPPAFEDDYFSLGSMLYSLILPIQEFFPLNPDAHRRFYASLERDFDLPKEMGELIFALHEGELDRAEEALQSLEETFGERGNRSAPEEGGGEERSLAWVDNQWDPQHEAAPEIGEAMIRETLDGITDYILATADLEREDRLWPSDYRVFRTNPLNVAYGAWGIALYLRQVLGEIPDRFARWMDERPLDLEAYPPGLFTGLAGIAWARMEAGQEEKALEAMDLAYESPLLHESPDLCYGAAGTGLASLYFWHRTGDDRFLEEARKAAHALGSTARPDEDGHGAFWRNVDGEHYYGYGHGASGPAFFLLELFRATRQDEYLALGKAALEHEMAAAILRDDYAVWHRSTNNPILSPYWRYGAAGIGSVLIRYYRELRDERYRELAHKAARYVSSKYVVFPGQFVGLSGMGEFLLDMHHVTGEKEYLEEAWRLAEGIRLYRIEKSDGLAFPGEEVLRISNDFGTGSAGIGMFLLRLLQPGGRWLYELEPMKSPAGSTTDRGVPNGETSEQASETKEASC